MFNRAPVWRATLRFTITIAVAMIAAPSVYAESRTHTHASSSNSAAATKSTDAASSMRTENLAFALKELNRLAGFVPLLRVGDKTPPAYAIEEVFRDTTVKTEADLISLVPVYRTVRGWDEKRRRPVLYQTLVHEERFTRAVVDTSQTFHLVLRRVTTEEQRELEERLLHLRRKECGTSESPECLIRPTPDPLTLIHALVTVSVCKDASRAITMLRSVNEQELALWWDQHAMNVFSTLKLTEGDQITSERVAELREHSLFLRRNSPLTLPKLLAAGGWSSKEAEILALTNASASKRSGTVKVMSANIFNYNYWTQRQPLLSTVFQSETPDLIGFQEVRAVKSGPGTGQGRWQISDLAKMLPPEMEYIYSPAMGFKEGQYDFVHEGLAIFSRFPIDSITPLKLSRDSQDGQDFHQRLCLHARVRTPQGMVNLMDTHLSLSYSARARTLPEIAAFSAKFPNEPILLLGDFNAQFQEGPSLLTDRAFGGFTDTWLQVHAPVLGERVERDGWTFHAWDHRSRIDFIFYQSQDKDQGATIPSLAPSSIRVVGKEGKSLHGEALPPIGGIPEMKDTMFPSDHMLLSAEFTIDPQLDLRKAKKASTASASTSSSSSSSAPTGITDDILHAAQKRAAELTAQDPDKPQPLYAGVGTTHHDEL